MKAMKSKWLDQASGAEAVEVVPSFGEEHEAEQVGLQHMQRVSPLNRFSSQIDRNVQILIAVTLECFLYNLDSHGACLIPLRVACEVHQRNLNHDLFWYAEFADAHHEHT